MRYRVAIRFVIQGDLRFISHHDTMRLFERALARARLPVRFSMGFNPRPGISLPLPRPVGVASDDELLVVELCEPTEPSEVVARLARQAPEGMKLLQARYLDTGAAVQPEQVTYEVGFAPEYESAVAAAVGKLLACDQWCIGRRGNQDRADKIVDLRAYLLAASVDGGVLRWTARVTTGGSVRPAEMLSACGLDPASWRHRVRRTEVRWSAFSTPD
ncbi:MAG TPA: TIGR03936 family radical SAM-associated protein [Phycisphaerae bacterium]|nr:TIGR03936 family radical SAM-associated protein [Phycisphaerae bacterium]